MQQGLPRHGVVNLSIELVEVSEDLPGAQSDTAPFEMPQWYRIGQLAAALAVNSR